MATLSVLKFDTPDAAQQVLDELQNMQRQQLLTLEDAAIVSWPPGAKKPKTKQTSNLAGAGALGGAFWGMLFGLLFFIPFLGLAIGAGMGALMGAFSDYGIDDSFINQVRDQVTPGTSALFLMTSNVTIDKVVPELKKYNPQLISTNLSAEQEEKLKAAFAEG